MYGYDSFSFDDNTFDESYYLETLKPITKVENFDNIIDGIMNSANDANIKASNENNINIDNLKDRYINNLNTTKYLSSTCNKYKKIIKDKFDENYYLKNQLHIFYFLLFISILVIISQKISCNNLHQIIYILKLNSGMPDLSAPISGSLI